MGLVLEQDAFRRDLAKLWSFIESRGLLCTVGEVERTRAQQEEYVRLGLSKTMNSYHLRRLAADLFVYRENPDGGTAWLKSKNDLQEIGDFWESLGPKNRWGGNWASFQDCPHFERRV